MIRRFTSFASGAPSAALLLILLTSACGTSLPESNTTPAGSAPPDPVIAPIRDTHIIEARGKRLYLDGEPFYVRGVGYEAGCRPGKLPWARPFEPEILAHDFREIRRAGFNTIRTWSPMTDSELAIAADHGLWVIQGIWTDWNKFWTDAAYHTEAVANVRREVTRSAKHPNILYYLVMNEPAPDVLIRLDPALVDRGFRDLVDAAHAADSDALVSFSNCPLADFLDTGPWDIVSSNNYPYGPEPVLYSGIKPYTEWIVKRAGARPYLTTEFGLSVSPEGPGKSGYGGNTLTEQAEGVSRMYREIAASGAAGACAFMWVDGWWKSPNPGPVGKNEDNHDSHAEEWFGFVDVSPQNYKGTLRPVVAAMTEVNRLIVLSPAPGDVAESSLTVRVVTPGPIPQARFADASFATMKRIGHEEYSLELEGLKTGPTIIEVKSGETVRRIPVHITDRSGAPGRISVALSAAKVNEAVPLTATIRFEDFTGSTPAGRPVRIIIHDYASIASRRVTAVTDSRGMITFAIPTIGRTGQLGFTVAADMVSAGETRTVSDLAFFKVTPEPRPERWLSGHRPTAHHGFDIPSRDKANEFFAERYTGTATIAADAAAGALLLKYGPEKPGAWIYIARRFAESWNISGARFLSFDLSGSRADAQVKVMLVDRDGERWFAPPSSIPARGSRRVVWSLTEPLDRDPWDGAKNGNNRIDLDNIAGIAVVITGSNATEARLAKLTAWM